MPTHGLMNWWKGDTALLVQLEQESTRSEVLDLAGGGSPFPLQAQLSSQTLAAPILMLSNPLLQPRQFGRTNFPALTNKRFFHEPTLPKTMLEVQTKIASEYFLDWQDLSS